MKCRNCKHLYKGWCAHKLDSPDPELERECKDYMQATNADRIRTMTDEELSYFLCDFRTGSAGEHHCAGCKAEEYCRTGHNGMIEWLQQPAKED